MIEIFKKEPSGDVMGLDLKFDLILNQTFLPFCFFKMDSQVTFTLGKEYGYVLLTVLGITEFA